MTGFANFTGDVHWVMRGALSLSVQNICAEAIIVLQSACNANQELVHSAPGSLTCLDSELIIVPEAFYLGGVLSQF